MNQKSINGDIRAQMFDLIVEAASLSLPYEVYRNPKGESCVDFIFDTTDAQVDIGKAKIDYRIPKATISITDCQDDINMIRDAFEAVRNVDAARKAVQEVAERAKARKMTR